MEFTHLILFISCLLKTVYSDCPPDSASFEIILNVDKEALANLFASSSDNSGSTKTFYSQEPIKCTKDSDCSKQGCCGQKTVRCNKNSGSCGCFDSDKNEFGKRPIIFMQNIGSCGPSNGGCTICIDGDSTKAQKIINDVPQRSWNVSRSAVSLRLTRLNTWGIDFLDDPIETTLDTRTITENVRGIAFSETGNNMFYLNQRTRTPVEVLQDKLAPLLCSIVGNLKH